VTVAGSEHHHEYEREHEVIVAADGSIPAVELAKLGVRPGQHLRVVVNSAPGTSGVLRGSLTGYPEPTWEDFEYASAQAREDFGLT